MLKKSRLRRAFLARLRARTDKQKSGGGADCPLYGHFAGLISDCVMRIRVWSPVQVVPDVTGTEQHTGQMFVVDTCSKNRICMATKRNIKHEGASKWPIYIQITVSLRLCRALLSTNGQGKPRRPGGLESAVNLGKLIHCALRLSVGRRRAELQSVKQSCRALTVGTTPKKRPYYKAVQKHIN